MPNHVIPCERKTNEMKEKWKKNKNESTNYYYDDGRQYKCSDNRVTICWTTERNSRMSIMLLLLWRFFAAVVQRRERNKVPRTNLADILMMATEVGSTWTRDWEGACYTHFIIRLHHMLGVYCLRCASYGVPTEIHIYFLAYVRSKRKIIMNWTKRAKRVQSKTTKSRF